MISYLKWKNKYTFISLRLEAVKFPSPEMTKSSSAFLKSVKIKVRKAKYVHTVIGVVHFKYVCLYDVYSHSSVKHCWKSLQMMFDLILLVLVWRQEHILCIPMDRRIPMASKLMSHRITVPHFLTSLWTGYSIFWLLLRFELKQDKGHFLWETGLW